MRDDPLYWDALSVRIVSRIRSRREMRLGWRVWAVPFVAAAALMVIIARVGRPPAVERAPTIAAMLTTRGQAAPSIAGLLQEHR